MHVKNGDKQTNGKLNSRSRIKEIVRTSKLTHTYQSVERNNQKPNSSLDITYQTDKFYWNKELWKEQPRSQQFESWEFLFHTVSLSQSLFTAYKDKPAFVIWISYHWKGRYHTTVQSNFHMEHLIFTVFLNFVYCHNFPMNFNSEVNRHDCDWWCSIIRLASLDQLSPFQPILWGVKVK